MRRRRRFFREDVLAPWLTLLVVIGLWWAGSILIGSSGPATAPAAHAAPTGPPAADRVAPLVAPPQPREQNVADAPDPHPAIESASPRDAREDAVFVGGGDIDELHARHLAVPVQGIQPSQLVSNFDDSRGSGRKHEALDILSPRGTPVLAAEDGRIVKLFTSARGGLTIYQFDPSDRFCYYYAHLAAYAADLKEGQTVRREQVIGYVGTTGNAPSNTPHLHLAILKLGPEKRWWEGVPLDPAVVLR